MKTLIIIPLLLFYLTGFAQKVNDYTPDYAKNEKRKLTPGVHLNRAGNLLITGLFVGLGGGIVSGIGAAKGNKPLIYSGIGINAGALFVTLTGYAQIKRSGNKLHEKLIKP